MSVKETAKHTGLSTYYLYNLVRAGKIKTAKIGVKYMIHIESLIDDVLNGRV
jgi:excisionase family DNA binding protein